MQSENRKLKESSRERSIRGIRATAKALAEYGDYLRQERDKAKKNEKDEFMRKRNHLGPWLVICGIISFWACVALAIGQV